MKSLPKKYRRNFGFSVVEVLVASAIVAIVGAGLASVLTSASKQQKGIQAKDQQRDVTFELRGLLANQTACTNTFAAVGDNSYYTNGNVGIGTTAPSSALQVSGLAAIPVGQRPLYTFFGIGTEIFVTHITN